MNAPVIPIQVLRDPAVKPRRASGDRPVDAQALSAVQALLAARPQTPLRRDLLIEHLHTLNDHFGQLATTRA